MSSYKKDVFLELTKIYNKHLVKDLILNIQDMVMKVDYLLLGGEKIYLIFECNYKGKIMGEEESDTWLCIDNNKLKSKPNKYLEVKDTLNYLKGNIPCDNLIPIVVFTEATDVNELNIPVNKKLINELKEYLVEREITSNEVGNEKILSWVNLENMKLNRIRLARKAIDRNININELYEKTYNDKGRKIFDFINRRSLKPEIDDLLIKIYGDEVLSEVILCGKDRIGKLDYILIREDGIYVFQVCSSAGIIETDMRGEKWCSKISGYTKEFTNPTLNLGESIEILKEVINKKYHQFIKGVVVFTNATSITGAKMNFDGIRIIEVEEYFKRKNSSVIDRDEKALLREEILICNIRDKKIRSKRNKLGVNYRIKPIEIHERMSEVDRVKILLEMRNEAM